MSIKIERGIKIPPIGGKSKGKGKWQLLFEEMKPGDSILLTIKESRAARQSTNRTKTKIVTRTVSPTHVRVWKV